MNRIKGSVEPLAMFVSASAMLTLLPPPVSRRMIDFYADKCTCVLTNVPGPTEPMYLAGCRVDDVMFWVPQRASIGLGLSLMSYAGSAKLGVISDTALLDEPQAFVEAFAAAFDELEAAL